MRANNLQFIKFLAFSLIFLSSRIVSASGCGTLPTSVSSLTQACIPINITNSQTSATPTGFQQMLSFNALAYQSYLAGSLQNIYVYNSISGMQMPAWIEGNVLNEGQTTNLNTASNVIIWVNLGANTIGASSSANDIYYIGIGATSTNFFISGNQIGEAPQLSSTYAQYDNGANVFTNYWNFAGTAIPTGWTTSGTGITINNGITIIDPSSTASYAQTISNFGLSTYILEWFGSYPAGTVTYIGGVGYGSGGNQGWYTNTWSGWCSSTGVIAITGQNPVSCSTGIISAPVSGLFGVYWNSNSTSATLFYFNYNQIVTGTGAGSAMPIAVISDNTENSGTFNYIRTRAYPPNGVMPSVSFGALASSSSLSLTFSPGSTVTYPTSVSAQATSNPNTDTVSIYQVGDSTPLCTGTGSCSYTIGILGAGAYSYNAVDSTLQTTTGTQVLTVDKNATQISWASQCANPEILFAALPNPCITTAKIQTYNNQALGGFYLNNQLLANVGQCGNYAYCSYSYNLPTNEIGTYAFTFNTLGNGNYLSNSIAYSTEIYEPTYGENVLATGATKTFTLDPANSPYTWPTSYPIKIYTSSPSNTLTYTLQQTINSVTSTLVSNALNLSFVPQANQITGNYVYNIFEFQNGNSNSDQFQVAANVLNMTDITGPFTYGTSANTLCQYVIQYAPNCVVFPFGANSFTVSPHSWSIKSDVLGNQHSNSIASGNSIEQWSNANLTFSPIVTLVYPFVSFVANVVNNPSMTNSITQTKYVFTASNTIPAAPNTRKLLNITSYDQRTFNKLSSNTTIALSALFNNYSLANVTTYVYNSLTSTNFFLYIPSSNYQNPQISITKSTLTAQAISHFLAIDNYCPTIVNSSTYLTYHPYLVDLNGSLYTFNVYSGYGGGGIGDYMQVLSGVIPSSAVLVQQYQLNSNPFALALENGGSYQFKFLGSNCNLLYATNFSIWGNPITINIPINNTVPIITLPNTTATCLKVPVSANVMNITCSGNNRSSKVYSWVVNLYNTSINGYNLISTNQVNSSAFSYTFNGLSNTSIYRVIVIAQSPGLLQSFTFDFNGNNFQTGFGIALRAFITLLFLLVGLGLSSVGESQGAISAVHAVSSTLIVEAFMLALSYMAGVSTFIPFYAVVILVMFLGIIGIMSHRYESGMYN